MSVYTFETITTAQALNFDTNFDSLVFTGPGSTAGGIQVAYDAVGQTGDIAITSQGRTVVFGGGFRDEDHITFPDGTAVSIGGTFVGPPLAGGPENDVMFAGVEGGSEDGGAGNDTLVSSQGAFLTGGAGADLFIVHYAAFPFPIHLTTTTIGDWQAGDRLSFGPLVATASNYTEIALGPNASEDDAAAAANALIATGAADFVAVQVPFGVFVYADSNNDNGVADAKVLLETTVANGGITLASIDSSMIVATAAQPTFGVVPFILAGAAAPGSGASGTITGNMDAAQLHDLNPAIIHITSPTEFRADGDGGLLIDVVGHNLDYTSGLIDAGRLDHITFVDVVGGTTNLSLSLTEPDIDAQQLTTWLVADNIAMAYGALLAGNDTIGGGAGSDVIRGGGGDDTISGNGGSDRLYGDSGHDTLQGGVGDDHLIGGTNSDLMIGGGGADVFELDINDSSWIPGTDTSTNELDHITDWTNRDTLQFVSGPTPTAGNYVEITISTLRDAATVATNNVAQGIAYTVAQVGLDVVVFAPGEHDAVILTNRTLADISSSNIVVSAVAPLSPPPPPISPPPPPVTQVHNGTAGDDVMLAGGIVTEVHAGSGNDTILGTSGNDYLRGDDGDDSISGGSDFDDINGNMGNDTAHGNAGDDWVVGGKDQDILFGDDGNDIVLGNLGNDTLDGGNGNDTVRGGQGDDTLAGGAGNDFISGDRGNDTESGGAGADRFHDSQDAGIDRVLDFHITEGDQVELDPGTTYTLVQQGADTIIDFGGGNEMILVGVQLSTLTGNWIFLG